MPDVYVGGKPTLAQAAEEEQLLDKCFEASGWLSRTAATAGDDIGTQTSGLGALTFGRALDAETTVGGTISISATDLDGNAFDMGTGVGVSIWSEYSQRGLARTGWQLGAALGLGTERGDITRGLGLSNVMPATGEADLSTAAAQISAGYGFQRNDWIVTPSASLAYFNTRRSAYVEEGADFNASYDALSMNRR